MVDQDILDHDDQISVNLHVGMRLGEPIQDKDW